MRLVGVELARVAIPFRVEIGTAVGVHRRRELLFVRVVAEESEAGRVRRLGRGDLGSTELLWTAKRSCHPSASGRASPVNAATAAATSPSRARVLVPVTEEALCPANACATANPA